MDNFDPEVYKAWPLDLINREISEFNHIMHDGAGVPELEAGLRGLDFLTRKSELDDNTYARLDGCTTEAAMRIELMLAKEAQDRTEEQALAKARRLLKNLELSFRAILKNVPIWASQGESHLREKYGIPHEDLDEDED